MPSSLFGPGGPSSPYGSSRLATYAAWASCCQWKSLQWIAATPGVVVVVVVGRVVVVVVAARREAEDVRDLPSAVPFAFGFAGALGCDAVRVA